MIEEAAVAVRTEQSRRVCRQKAAAVVRTVLSRRVCATEVGGRDSDEAALAWRECKWRLQGAAGREECECRLIELRVDTVGGVT